MWGWQITKLLLVNILKKSFFNCFKHIFLFSACFPNPLISSLQHQINCIVYCCVVVWGLQVYETNTNCQVSSGAIYKGFVICHMLKYCMTQMNREKELEAVNLLWNSVWAQDASEIMDELIALCGWLVIQIPMLLAANTDTYEIWNSGITSHFSPHHQLKTPLALYQTHVTKHTHNLHYHVNECIFLMQGSI